MLQASIFLKHSLRLLNIVFCNIISIEFVPDSSNLFPWFSFNLPLLLIISDKKFQFFFFCIIVWEIFRISRSSVQNCIGLNECVKMNQANQNECVRLLKMDGSSQSVFNIDNVERGEGQRWNRKSRGGNWHQSSPPSPYIQITQSLKPLYFIK